MVPVVCWSVVVGVGCYGCRRWVDVADHTRVEMVGVVVDVSGVDGDDAGVPYATDEYDIVSVDAGDVKHTSVDC